MKFTEGRDPWAMIAVAVSIIVNLLGIAWVGGKFDARVAAAESRINKLESKAEKDAQQDVQIAVISTQLATISTNIGEINVKLERQ